MGGAAWVRMRVSAAKQVPWAKEGTSPDSQEKPKQKQARADNARWEQEPSLWVVAG